MKTKETQMQQKVFLCKCKKAEKFEKSMGKTVQLLGECVDLEADVHCI